MNEVGQIGCSTTETREGFRKVVENAAKNRAVNLLMGKDQN